MNKDFLNKEGASPTSLTGSLNLLTWRYVSNNLRWKAVFEKCSIHWTNTHWRTRAECTWSSPPWLCLESLDLHVKCPEQLSWAAEFHWYKLIFPFAFANVSKMSISSIVKKRKEKDLSGQDLKKRSHKKLVPKPCIYLESTSIDHNMLLTSLPDPPRANKAGLLAHRPPVRGWLLVPPCYQPEPHSMPGLGLGHTLLIPSPHLSCSQDLRNGARIGDPKPYLDTNASCC